MKKYVLISATTAVLVTATLLIAAYYMGWMGSQRFTIEHVNATPVKGALFTANERGEIVPLDFTQTSEKVLNSVVHITSTQVMAARGNAPQHEFFEDDLFERFFGPQFRFEFPRQPEGPQARTGSGSGVIISQDGYIVTNNHVIAEASDIEVALNDNRSYKAELVGTDPTTDLALLKIEEKGLPTLVFMNSDEVKVGEWVMAVGNPFNLNATVTAGIVSAKARNINILRDQFAIESFIQTDAAINPGNSGGALVDLEGRLIGINTAIASPTGTYSGYGFAIPSNIVRKVVEDLVEFGTVQRGFIGAMIRTVDNQLAQAKDLAVVQGVLIDSLVSGGAAEKAGIKAGDVIVGVEGKTIHTTSELLGMIGSHRPGDRLNIKVNRFGKEKEYQVTLNNKEGSTSRIRAETASYHKDLGVHFKVLSKEEAHKYGIDGGLAVDKIGPGAIRKQTDIREGFVITRVDRQRVRSLDELEKVLAQREGGILLEGIYPGQTGTYYYGLGM